MAGKRATRVRSSHKDLSLAVNSQDFLHTHGSFSRFSSTVRLLDFGEAELRFEFLHAPCAPQWANPLWDLLDVDIDTQAVQIAGLLDIFGGAGTSDLDSGLRTLKEEAIASGSSRLELRKRQALRALRILGLLSLEFVQGYGYWLIRGCGMDFLDGVYLLLYVLRQSW